MRGLAGMSGRETEVITCTRPDGQKFVFHRNQQHRERARARNRIWVGVGVRPIRFEKKSAISIVLARVCNSVKMLIVF